MGAGRKSIESGLADSLTDRNHMLDHLFKAETLQMKEKKKKKDDDDNEEEDLSDSEAELEIENGYKYIERVGVSNVFFCICIMGGCSFNE